MRITLLLLRMEHVNLQPRHSPSSEEDVKIAETILSPSTEEEADVKIVETVLSPLVKKAETPTCYCDYYCFLSPDRSFFYDKCELCNKKIDR